MKTFKERRKFPRINVKYKINIICEGEVILGYPAGYVFHTYTENLSEGGIRVMLEAQLKVGSLIKLELFLTTKESFPIEYKGIVVWTKQKNPKGTKPDLFDTGIQFLDFTSNVYRQLLTNVIKHYLEREGKNEQTQEG